MTETKITKKIHLGEILKHEAPRCQWSIWYKIGTHKYPLTTTTYRSQAVKKSARAKLDYNTAVSLLRALAYVHSAWKDIKESDKAIFKQIYREYEEKKEEHLYTVAAVQLFMDLFKTRNREDEIYNILHNNDTYRILKEFTKKNNVFEQLTYNKKLSYIPLGIGLELEEFHNNNPNKTFIALDIDENNKELALRAARQIFGIAVDENDLFKTESGYHIYIIIEHKTPQERDIIISRAQMIKQQFFPKNKIDLISGNSVVILLRTYDLRNNTGLKKHVYILSSTDFINHTNKLLPRTKKTSTTNNQSKYNHKVLQARHTNFQNITPEQMKYLATNGILFFNNARREMAAKDPVYQAVGASPKGSMEISTFKYALSNPTTRKSYSKNNKTQAQFLIARNKQIYNSSNARAALLDNNGTIIGVYDFDNSYMNWPLSRRAWQIGHHYINMTYGSLYDLMSTVAIFYLIDKAGLKEGDAFTSRYLSEFIEDPNMHNKIEVKKKITQTLKSIANAPYLNKYFRLEIKNHNNRTTFRIKRLPRQNEFYKFKEALMKLFYPQIKDRNTLARALATVNTLEDFFKLGADLVKKFIKSARKIVSNINIKPTAQRFFEAIKQISETIASTLLSIDDVLISSFLSSIPKALARAELYWDYHLYRLRA